MNRLSGTLPRDPLSDENIEAAAWALLPLLDGLTIIEAKRVLLRCREIIAQTHFVSAKRAEGEGQLAATDQEEDPDARPPGGGGVDPRQISIFDHLASALR